MFKTIFLFVTFSLLMACSQAPERKHAVASAHPMATQAGIEILHKGGNAFDAAVAVSATLAVVEPYSSGMGGGGFWLLYRAADQHSVMVDGREVAPLNAQRDMYLDDRGEIVPNLSIDGPLAAGIPGQPAALDHIARHYGKLPLRDTLAPAIHAAQNGFPVTEHYQRMAKFRLEALRASADATAIFLHNNEVPELGHIIRQPDLAKTLSAMAERSRDGFYRGKVAEQLLHGVQYAGGNWVAEDFKNYQVQERAPIVSEYRGYKITSVPPPSSGGVAITSMLHMLDTLNWHEQSGVMKTHLLVEVMRRAYRDRAIYLGDTDFVDVPIARLTSRAYAQQLGADIKSDKATPSNELPGIDNQPKGNHTTHFSIIDHEGNRVSATLSINYPFGSGFVPPGTGVLLNDEMDDFSAKPGTPNAYGLVGAEANAIAPGKRMLSSMSPTFIESEDKLAIIGTPGGSRIITMVLHGLLAVIDGKSAQEVVAQPRYHHQYLPDVIQFEPGALIADEQAELQFLGHALRELDSSYGNMQVVIVDKKNNQVTAASDPRGEGVAIVE